MQRWLGHIHLKIAIVDNKLHNMRTQAPLLAPIFRSAGQARLLSIALLDGEYSLSDLAARAGVAYPTAHREAARLLDAGILAERTVGRTRLIRANERSPIVPPLTDILRQTTGAVSMLRQEFSAIEGIEAAFIYGSFAARTLGVAGDAPNDIDVMVIGVPDADDVYDACMRVEDAVQRPVNPTILDRAEAEARSGFLDSIRTQATVPILGVSPWQ